MMSTLLTYLKYEQQILTELVELAEKQQKALVKYKIPDLEYITSYQSELAANLKNAEDQRITLLMSWLGITRKEALGITISSLEEKFAKEEISELGSMKAGLKDLTQKLMYLNTLNRVLTNKAIGNNQKMLSLFTNGTNYVCNVKI